MPGRAAGAPAWRQGRVGDAAGGRRREGGAYRKTILLEVREEQESEEHRWPRSAFATPISSRPARRSSKRPEHAPRKPTPTHTRRQWRAARRKPGRKPG